MTRTRPNGPHSGQDDLNTFCRRSSLPIQNPSVRASTAMNSCFNSDKKVPLTLSQTSRRPKKMVNTPSAERKKTCVPFGQRLGHRQPEKRADQNAQGVEKCASHTLTQRGVQTKRKPENFCPDDLNLLLKQEWPAQKPVCRSPVVLDSHALCGGRAALCAGHVGVGRALQKSRRVERGHRVLHELAVFAVGHQTALESAGGSAQNAAAMDLGDAIASWRRLAGVALTIPAPHFFSSAGVFLASGLRFGHPRHRGGRLLHAGDAGASAGVLHRRAHAFYRSR